MRACILLASVILTSFPCRQQEFTHLRATGCAVHRPFSSPMNREKSPEDKDVPDYTAVRSQDAVDEGYAVVGAERARGMDRVPKARKKDLAIALELDLLPASQVSVTKA
uniref:Mixed-linked glucanase n=1 Tax=Ganoderma boninense TaxID=34458 RepID=A0A5K1K7C6_9APHY|nr:Mixed-linked glucanase [Ganoderma boninense]